MISFGNIPSLSYLINKISNNYFIGIDNKYLKYHY
jgi:hypothetical protein